MAAINYDFPLDPNGHSESELITALYLYGDKVKVQNGNVIVPQDEELLNSSLIREELVVPAGTTNPNNINIDIIEVEVDEVDYMTNGPGRFANGYQFDLVKAFFGETAAAMKSKNGKENYQFNPALLKTFGSATYNNQGKLISRTYTRKDIDQIYFQNLLEGYSANLELRDYDDGTDNFNQRIYTWNSQQYSLPDSIEFVVYFDPADSDKIIGREIKNFHIDPNVRTNYEFKENFDFDTANPIVEAASKQFLEPRVDPSGIGRTVYFDFVNRDSPQDASYLYDPVDTGSSVGTYDREDFNQDSIKERDTFLNYSFPVSAANAGIRTIAEANKVFDLGVTEFLYKDKPLSYGTVDDDNLRASDFIESNFPLWTIKGANGIVLLGGQGNDTISGDFRGGVTTDDILVGHEGNDSLNGRESEDIAIYFDSYTDANGNPNYDISTDSNTKVTTITHLNGGVDGTDTLENIEFAQFNGDRGQQVTVSSISSKENPTPLGGTNGATTNSTESATTRIIPLPLEDGVEKTEFVEVADTTPNPNSNDLPTPPYVSLTAPVDMLDGDIEYTLNISPYKPDTQHNIVYILDTSLSIDATELQTMKDAYTNLTNYYINEGVAQNINFGVVSYDTSSRFHLNSTGDKNLTADEAISAINSLTTSSGIGTNYDAGLWNGVSFLTTSPYRPSFPVSPGGSSFTQNPDGTTSIAYFFTDGQNTSDRFTMLNTAKTLRKYSNVQAIGYYSELDTLTSDSLKIRDVNWVDSNQGVFIDDASALSSELLKSDLADDVELVNILLDGEVVDTLTPDQLTDSPMGLTYEGTVDNLDVSIDAENIVTAEVVFTPESNFATTTVDYTVTAGQGEVLDQDGNPIDESGNEDVDPFERERIGSDGDDDITLGNVDRGASGGAGGDYIVGNRRDNILDGGAGDDTIFGHEGNDTIITGSGINKVDGGEDIDTVLYNDVSYQGNSSLSFSQTGSTLIYSNSANYPDTDYLTNVEYLQFSDVRLDASTLEITPTIAELSDVSVTEGETASFTFNLDYPASTDIVFDYATQDIDAVALSDYTATSGQITIPAGDTTATINISTIEDTVYDEGTQTFSLNLTNLTGATFNNNETELSLTAYIEDRDEPLTLIGTNQDDVLTGGSENDSLKGGNGNDYLYANGGNDTLRGDAGDDLIDGGEGDDSLFGNAGNDTVIGGDGYDRIVEISNGNFVLSDTQLNANGIDSIDGIEIANLTGGNSNNSINASAVTAIDTIIKSQAGNDTIRGGGVKDIIDAGADDDVVIASAGNDNIKGGTGNDSLNGSFGNDTIVGASGDDTIVGGSGFDVLIERADSDFILTNSSLVGNGTDSLTAIQQVNLTGEEGNNVIDASAVTTINKTILTGGGGDDTIKGGAKQDTLIGEAGSDLLEGGDLRDILYGGVGNDVLMGMSGNDVLKGEAGDDTLVGGAGFDVLTGGVGSDVFEVEVTTTGRDVILDFEVGVDYLSLGENLSFEDLRIVGNAAGTVSAIRLESNNQLLTVIKDVSYSDLSAADFV